MTPESCTRPALGIVPAGRTPVGCLREAMRCAGNLLPRNRRCCGVDATANHGKTETRPAVAACRARVWRGSRGTQRVRTDPPRTAQPFRWHLLRYCRCGTYSPRVGQRWACLFRTSLRARPRPAVARKLPERLMRNESESLSAGATHQRCWKHFSLELSLWIRLLRSFRLSMARA